MKFVYADSNTRKEICELARAVAVMAKYDTAEAKHNLLAIPEARVTRPKEDQSESYVIAVRNFHADGTAEQFLYTETFTKPKPATTKTVVKHDWDALVALAREYNIPEERIASCSKVTTETVAAEDRKLKSCKFEPLGKNATMHAHVAKLLMEK